MSALGPPPEGPSSDELSEDPAIGRIVEGLGGPGWAVEEDFVPAGEVDELIRESRRLWEDGEFRHAGVGVGPDRVVRPEVRRDHVLWLDETVASPAHRRYLDRIEILRSELNRALYLGLFDFEAHLTVYPPGAFYRKHLDQFRTVPLRTVSAILYLNPDWAEADGGQLRIYLGEDGSGPTADVVPRAGTLAVFLSARFFHEVLPSARERMSITGWIKRRA